MTRRGHRHRSFTLIELVITVAIFTIVAGLGAYAGKNALPRWQTRSMALRVKTDLERCRAIAVTYGSYCRMLITQYDAGFGTDDIVNGQYKIQWCNTKTGGTYAAGTCWDTLPIDLPDSTGIIGEGLVDVAKDAKHVSITGFGGASADPHHIAWASPLDVVNNNAIVFDWRGAAINPAANYTQDGHLYIDVANKFVSQTTHTLECYVVRVGANGAQSGLVTVSRVDAGCPASVSP